MGTARRLGYGEGSVYRETVSRTSGGKVRRVVVYRGEIVIDGKRRRVTRSTRAAALTELDKLRAAANAGLPTGDGTRLGQFLDWYVEKVIAKKHPNTQSSYIWAFRQLEPLRGKRLRELTPNDVEVLLEQLSPTESPLRRLRSDEEVVRSHSAGPPSRGFDRASGQH
jgi:hypothetical protein